MDDEKLRFALELNECMLAQGGWDGLGTGPSHARVDYGEFGDADKFELVPFKHPNLAWPEVIISPVPPGPRGGRCEPRL